MSSAVGAESVRGDTNIEKSKNTIGIIENRVVVQI